MDPILRGIIVAIKSGNRAKFHRCLRYFSDHQYRMIAKSLDQVCLVARIKPEFLSPILQFGLMGERMYDEDGWMPYLRSLILADQISKLFEWCERSVERKGMSWVQNQMKASFNQETLLHLYIRSAFPSQSSIGNQYWTSHRVAREYIFRSSIPTPDVIRKLVQFGVDIHLRDAIRYSALDLAAKNNLYSCIPLLLVLESGNDARRGMEIFFHSYSYPFIFEAMVPKRMAIEHGYFWLRLYLEWASGVEEDPIDSLIHLHSRKSLIEFTSNRRHYQFATILQELENGENRTHLSPDRSDILYRVYFEPSLLERLLHAIE